MYRSRLRLALGVVLVLVTTACGSSTNGNTSSSTIQGMIKTITPGVLTIATYGSALPLMKVGPGANEIGGLSGGWANAFAQDFGLQVKLFQTTFSSTLLAVQQGKADLGEPVYYNPTRAKTYYYTYPVDLESLVVFTKKSFSYSGPSSLICSSTPRRQTRRQRSRMARPRRTWTPTSTTSMRPSACRLTSPCTQSLAGISASRPTSSRTSPIGS